MKIRDADPDECSELTDIARSAKAHWGYSDADLQAWREELEISRASIQQQPTFVAQAHGSLHAVLQLSTKSSPWEIEALWVSPSSMGHGLGKALVRHAVHYARRHDQVSLAIDADPNAERFYLALGATRVGEVTAPVAGDPARVRPQLVLSTSGPLSGSLR